MSTLHYVDTIGNYLGGFDGAEPPEGAIEVSTPPASALDIWDGEAWVVTPVVPKAVTMRQARLALMSSSLLTQVEAAINSLPSPQKEAARIEWDYSSEVFRYKELVAVLGSMLELSDQQLDELFILAGSL